MVRHPTKSLKQAHIFLARESETSRASISQNALATIFDDPGLPEGKNSVFVYKSRLTANKPYGTVKQTN
jgi:hypothetical protein